MLFSSISCDVKGYRSLHIAMRCRRVDRVYLTHDIYLKNWVEQVSIGQHELETQYLWDAFVEVGSASHKYKKT